MKHHIKKIISLLTPVFLVGLFLVVDQHVSRAIFGFDNSLSSKKIELVFILVAYYSTFFLLRAGRARYIISLLPIILFYSFYYFHFYSFGTIFKFIDITELPELIVVLSDAELLLFLAFPLTLFISLYAFRGKRFKPSGTIPVASFFIIGLFIHFFPKTYQQFFEDAAYYIIPPWSEAFVSRNGFLATTLYFESKRLVSINSIKENYNRPEYNKEKNHLVKQLSSKLNSKNVHLIMLESFFNPTLLARFKYSKQVYHSDFIELLSGNESLIQSPVFGGKTSQAEFEALCGVPSLEKYGSVEFNAFTGSNAFCLPKVLGKLGYSSIASNAYRPDFFNAIKAYKGIGFERSFFPIQFAPGSKTYLRIPDEQEYMFDGDLFSQNLEQIKTLISKNAEKPIFNYVLGVYGHRDFHIDIERHPLFIKVLDGESEVSADYERAVNQIYYRTKAVADYVNQLLILDPESMIILSSDHLPNFDGKEWFKTNGYLENEVNSHFLTSLFIFKNGKPTNVGKISHYELPNLILDFLTEGHYCAVNNCIKNKEQLAVDYKKVLAHAIIE
ncbi:sulfatase-like hydrolase/transferase [Brumicola blandensis]|uniref:Sulfatase-like hydrolase/transferase n=1 Tax=Brumicola blandensis TaxID=3075611 RepID=A0AAW8R0A3_9ALTE|nr:sulfatase-like hydrolase/transferase [Alteromonas sp. W409]MDT0582632.1 sulfatase-like hydrolase/transferase [Alteromonas sp. W409]